MVFLYGRLSILLGLKHLVLDALCIQGIGCLMSRDIEDVVVGWSSSEEIESSSEVSTCSSGAGEFDNIATVLGALVVGSLVHSWIEFVEVGSDVGCTWGCKVGCMGFGLVGNTFLLAGSLVFLCLLVVVLWWYSSSLVWEGRLASSLTLLPRSVDILESG